MKLRTKILGINLLALVCILVTVSYISSPYILSSKGEDNLKFFVIIMFGIGVLSILISATLLDALVIRRISDLTEKVDHIKNYRSYYEALNTNGKDEVATLAKATNQMLQRIVSSTNEVGQLNARLQEEKASVEKVVAQRTEQLNAEKARLKASVTNLSLGFIMTDQQNNVLLINGRAQQILEGRADENGISPEPDVKHIWSVSDIDGKLGEDFALLEKLARSLRSGETTDFSDVEYGGRILRILISPILETFHKSSTVLGCVIILEDVTEQKVLERSRDEFFSIASHELRTPLTAIRGNTSLIKQFYEERVNDSVFNEMVDDIHSSSVRLIQIVNDFLDMSRIEQGKIKFKVDPFDITEVIENVVYEMDALARDKQNQLYVDKTLKNLPPVLADKDRVKQIIYNLVGNAMKFTEKGTINIKAEKQGSMVKVLVSDTGPGISDDGQKVLFRKFRQAGPNSLTRETSRGTGLGLYISKLLVGRMGGAITLEHSELGKGTTFSFTLPLSKD